MNRSRVNPRISPILAASALVFTCVSVLFSSCNPEVKAVSGLDVEIKIEPMIVSSGFMNFSFETNKEAYFHIGIVPAEEFPDTTSTAKVKAFMALKLDGAYLDYITWRYMLLECGTPYVAEFPTHSLQYGRVEYNFTSLKPDTEYVVYAFAVDAKTNKPDGRLFTYHVRTEKESQFEDMQFEYRVRGYWDYIYPVSTGGEVLPFVPWVGNTIDSLSLADMPYVKNPMDYFSTLFAVYVDYKVNDIVHFGIYVHNNGDIGNGTSDIFFDSDHVYYTAMALMDGYLSEQSIVIYKFRWKDENTQFFFNKSDAMTTEW